MKFTRYALSLLAATLLFSACDDDEGSYANDYALGAPCGCEGEQDGKYDGCVAVGVIPLPSPINNNEFSGKIVGCEGVDVSKVEGGKLVCLRTMPENATAFAPATYFPEGYCAISAVSCTGSDTWCGTVGYGDIEKLNSCPKGSVLMHSIFDFEIMHEMTTIEQKVCARSCKSDADCNGNGEISCLNKNGYKFCYNDKNFEFLGDNVTYQKF